MIFRNVFKSIGLRKILLKLNKQQETPQQFHNLDWWFSKGKDPYRVSLTDAIKSYDSLNILPKEIVKFLEPWLKEKISERKCYSIAAVILLSRVYAASGID